jgi:hypothetical protein
MTDIPPGVEGDLTDQQEHDRDLELEARADEVLTYWRLGDSLTQTRSEVVDPPLGRRHRGGCLRADLKLTAGAMAQMVEVMGLGRTDFDTATHSAGAYPLRRW